MMIYQLLLLQVLLPIALIAAVAMLPARRNALFALQLIATGATLLALYLTGLWTVPPAWLFYCYIAAFLMAILIGTRRRHGSAGLRQDSHLGPLLAAVFLSSLSAVMLYQSWLGWTGRQAPAGRSVAVAFPLSSGEYLVVNGGANMAVNSHADALDQTIPAHQRWRGTAFGVDLVKIDSVGMRARGVQPSDPRNYHIYGTPVLSPVQGTVIQSVDGKPDMRVPDYDMTHMSGNHVIIRSGGIDIVLAHFRPGSVKVQIGQEVQVGDPIAEVGNSGATDEPHLHMHAQLAGTQSAPMAGAPVAMRFDGKFLVRSDVISSRLEVPVHGRSYGAAATVAVPSDAVLSDSVRRRDTVD